MLSTLCRAKEWLEASVCKLRAHKKAPLLRSLYTLPLCAASVPFVFLTINPVSMIETGDETSDQL